MAQMARSAPGTSRTFPECNSGVWFTPKAEVGQEPPGLAAAGSRVTGLTVAYDHQVPCHVVGDEGASLPHRPRLAAVVSLAVCNSSSH